MSDFVKTWPLGFRQELGAAQLQASQMSKQVGGLPSWSVKLDSPGTNLVPRAFPLKNTALTVGGWIRPGIKTSRVGRGLF